MNRPKRPNRKIDDATLVKLNSIGLSLKRIAKEFDCHPTTVLQRLQALGIEPSDTRRTFMEDIYTDLSPQMKTWLADQLGSQNTIKDFVKTILTEKYEAAHP